MTIVATLIAAIVPIAWALHYDRYKKSLDEHQYWTAWITALKSEVTHQLSSLSEIDSAFQQMNARKQLGGVTKRFNDDLFETARKQIIQHQRSPHVFTLLTRTYRDVAHTNAMLDRFEASVLKNGQWDQDELSHSIGSSVLGSLIGVRKTLTNMATALENEERLFESIKPRFTSLQ